MAEKPIMKGGPGRRPMGKPPKVENPGKLMKRLIAYIAKHYAFACICAIICIFISVLANVQGTLFTQTLIDVYILPEIGKANPDFTNLLHAMARVALFYLLGALSTFTSNRIFAIIFCLTASSLIVFARRTESTE